jgi:magnesium transporter
MLENFKEVVEALEDTNESIIAHRGNEVFRILAAFSAVLLPLTLIASVFGMNFAQPFGQGHGFAIAIAMMVVTLLGVLYYFRKRGFL